LQGKKGYTLGGAKTHSTKLLEVKPKIRKIIMNCIIPHRKQTNMLDLSATNPASNKKNLPLAPNPQKRKSTPQLNRTPSTTRRGMWMDETLKTTMDVVERGTHSLRRPNRSWNIRMSSIFNHLNGKIRSRKMGLRRVLTKERIQL
jgi:hypothetical protein